jgi:hypothetical protein
MLTNQSLFGGPPGAGAEFDAARVCRYRLHRHWRQPGEEARTALFIMLNPSTADEFVLDHTVTKCTVFTKRWGCNTTRVVNIFPVRSTDPYAMKRLPDPFYGDKVRADAVIVEEARTADLVICAWGIHGAHRGRSTEVRRLLAGAGVRPMCFGLTQRGEPFHPLMLPYGLQLQPFPLEG